MRDHRAKLYALLGLWLVLGCANVLAHGLLTRNLPRLDQPLWYIALALPQATLILGGVWLTRRVPEAVWRGGLGPLLLVVALPFLLNVGVQATWTGPKGSRVFGDTLDLDMGLYFCYGRQALGLLPTDGPPCANPAYGDGRYPLMEYPQGALALFTGGVALAGDSVERFRLLFPLLLGGFTLGCVALLHALGRAHNATGAATHLALLLSLSPYLARLAPVRYDIVPTFCLLLAVWLFTRRAGMAPPNPQPPSSNPHPPIPNPQPPTPILVGLALAAGGLLKWLPGLLGPFVLGYYVQQRQWRAAAGLLGAAAGLLLLVLLPFYWADAAKFWHPYQFQAGRALMGESAPFLLQWAVLDPAHTLPGRPWGEPPTILLSNGVITLVQGLLVGGLGVLAWMRARTAATWAVLGLMAVAAFTLSNRIFSPQFVIALGWTWAAALVLLRPGVRALLAALFALLLIGLANFLVFPLWPDAWPVASLVLFLLAGGLTGALVWAALAPPRAPAGYVQPLQGVEP